MLEEFYFSKSVILLSLMNFSWTLTGRYRPVVLPNSPNSCCIHPQELLCAGRAGWTWERSGIEHPLLYCPLVKPYFWHQFQSIKFPLHSFFYWPWSLDSLKITVSDFRFLEERRCLFKSLRPEISHLLAFSFPRNTFQYELIALKLTITCF